MEGLIASALKYGAGQGGSQPITFGGNAYSPNRIEKLTQYLDRNVIDTITTSDNRFDILLVNYVLKPEVVSELKEYKFHKFYDLFSNSPLLSDFTFAYYYNNPLGNRVVQKYLTPASRIYATFPGLGIEAVHKDSNSSVFLDVFLGTSNAGAILDMTTARVDDIPNDRIYRPFIPENLHITDVLPADKMHIDFETEYIYGGMPDIRIVVDEGKVGVKETYYAMNYTALETQLVGKLSTGSYTSNPPTTIQRYLPFAFGYLSNLGNAFLTRLWIYYDINPAYISYFLNAMWKSIFKSVGFYDNKLIMEW